MSEAQIPNAGYIFIAVTGMLDPSRPEVPDANERCHSTGIRVVMLTGDYGLTAETIARHIGPIKTRGTIVQGNELADTDDRQLTDILEEGELIFARISPAQWQCGE